MDITGSISNDHFRDIVSRSWINIHSSITEGFGYLILEAYASGTPTVAYSVPGVVEAIESGKNGITVKDGNREGLADAAKKIMGNFTHGWINSSRTVAEKYSWDITAGKWEQHLKRCAY